MINNIIINNVLLQLQWLPICALFHLSFCSFQFHVETMKVSKCDMEKNLLKKTTQQNADKYDINCSLHVDLP